MYLQLPLGFKFSNGDVERRGNYFHVHASSALEAQTQMSGLHPGKDTPTIPWTMAKTSPLYLQMGALQKHFCDTRQQEDAAAGLGGLMHWLLKFNKDQKYS